MEIIIKTTWFPFGTYDAMALWPLIFLKGSTPLHVLYHERIHLRQQAELLLVGFPLLYALFFVYHFVKNLLLDWDLTFKQCFDKAHEAVPFENEAYKNQYNASYLEERKMYAWARGMT